VFTVSLITLEIGSVVSHRGDIVRGKAKSHAVAFADACRNHWTTTPWLLWSDSLAVLVTVTGKRRPTLNCGPARTRPTQSSVSTPGS
jgi:hypothetical protein